MSAMASSVVSEITGMQIIAFFWLCAVGTAYWACYVDSDFAVPASVYAHPASLPSHRILHTALLRFFPTPCVRQHYRVWATALSTHKRPKPGHVLIQTSLSAIRQRPRYVHTCPASQKHGTSFRLFIRVMIFSSMSIALCFAALIRSHALSLTP